MSITPADMQNTIYIPKSYSDGGTGVAGPALKTAGGVIGTAADRGKHFMIPAGHKVSFDVRAGAGVREIFFGPPVAGPGINNAVYLPFLPNNVSSAVIDTTDHSITHFFTDGLSGCSIFVDTLGTDLIVHHANFMSQSPSMAQTKINPAFELPSTKALMQSLHSSAVDNQYNGAAATGSLFKTTYNAQGTTFVQRQRDLGRGSSADFWGGTTVIGFKTAAGWEFWYQTYASAAIGGTQNVIDYARFC